MIDSRYRTLYQKWCIDPLLGLPFIQRADPNLITFLAALSGISVLPLLFFDRSWLATLMLALSGFFDTLDGSLARKQQRPSSYGAVLDIVCDRLVESCVILGLYSVCPSERGMLALMMLGSVLICVTSFLVVGIFSENRSEKGFHYSPGMIERSEAFVFFGAMILLPALFTWLAAAFILLVSLTGVLRVYQFQQSHKTKAPR